MDKYLKLIKFSEYHGWQVHTSFQYAVDVIADIKATLTNGHSGVAVMYVKVLDPQIKLEGE